MFELIVILKNEAVANHISLHLSAITIPSVSTRSPTLLTEMHAQIMTDLGMHILQMTVETHCCIFLLTSTVYTGSDFNQKPQVWIHHLATPVANDYSSVLCQLPYVCLFCLP